MILLSGGEKFAHRGGAGRGPVMPGRFSSP